MCVFFYVVTLWVILTGKTHSNDFFIYASACCYQAALQNIATPPAITLIFLGLVTVYVMGDSNTLPLDNQDGLQCEQLSHQKGYQNLDLGTIKKIRGGGRNHSD